MVAKRHPRKRPPRTAKERAGTNRPPARDRRAAFAREYLIDHNATQAAIRAGYSAKSAHVTGSRLLSYADVRDIIDAADAKIAKKYDITREGILSELAKIAFSNPLDFGRLEDGDFHFDLTNTTRDHLAAVQELTTVVQTRGTGDTAVLERKTKLKLSNKRDALVDLGRAIGVFKDDPSAAQPVTFIIQNLHVGAPDGRSQGQGRSAEEFVDPALQARDVRRL